MSEGTQNEAAEPGSSPDASYVPPVEAVVALLAVLAYGTLVAFDRIAADARLAPDLRRRAMHSAMAAVEIGNYERLSARLTELGVDPERAMAPFVAPLDGYHDSTQPADWLEGLVKAYVGDGIADDFYREVAKVLEPRDRDLVLDVLHDTRYEDFASHEIRAAIAADPKLANRLALWARRLMGEALSQAQRVAAERDELTMLVLHGSGDLAGVMDLIKRLTAAHQDRMTSLGLNN
ncbi:MAG TPA: ferritin-like fold-containing protein [Actinocatenispora sp.]